MDKSDIAWLAGLFEGEGTFIWKKTGTFYGVPMARIKMADKDIIERVQVFLGGNIYEEKERQEGWKRQYCLAYQGNTAMRIMLLLRPYMGIRRSKRIDDLLTIWTNRPGVRRGSDSQLSKLTTEQVLEIRTLYSEGSKLKNDLAKQFNVTTRSISNIINQKTWKHL